MPMLNAVGLGQKFEFEADAAPAGSLRVHRRINFFPLRPFDGIAPQRPGSTNDGKEIPPRAAVRPAVLIGVEEIPPEKEAIDFIVESKGVVADAHRTGSIKPLPDVLRELSFPQSLFFAELRRDSGEQRALRARELIHSRTAIENLALRHGFKIEARAAACELCGAISLRIHAEGFVVVPVESGVPGLHLRHLLQVSCLLLCRLTRGSRPTLPENKRLPPREEWVFQPTAEGVRAPGIPLRGEDRSPSDWQESGTPSCPYIASKASRSRGGSHSKPSLPS